MRYLYNDWAIAIPMANESDNFDTFTGLLQRVMDSLEGGKAYLVIDTVSKDNTLELAKALQQRDNRFEVVWAPENKCVVDAYLKGLRVAYENEHEIIIEMDAGMSHDPRAIPMFLRVLNEGNDCAFGRRFINGGSMADSPFFRRFLSKGGTLSANLLLGTKMADITSGFQAFHRRVVGDILNYQFLSTAHSYQVELRFLLRYRRNAEIPIHYRAPSNSVSKKSIYNSIYVLFYYFYKRLTFNSVRLQHREVAGVDIDTYNMKNKTRI